jgi:hypothetical protein
MTINALLEDDPTVARDDDRNLQSGEIQHPTQFSVEHATAASVARRALAKAGAGTLSRLRANMTPLSTSCRRHNRRKKDDQEDLRHFFIDNSLVNP